MKKLITLILLCFITTGMFCQDKTYYSVGSSHILKDGANVWTYTNLQEIAFSIPKGKSATILGNNHANYYKVQYLGKKGYVSYTYFHGDKASWGNSKDTYNQRANSSGKKSTESLLTLEE